MGPLGGLVLDSREHDEAAAFDSIYQLGSDGRNTQRSAYEQQIYGGRRRANMDKGVEVRRGSTLKGTQRILFCELLGRYEAIDKLLISPSCAATGFSANWTVKSRRTLAPCRFEYQPRLTAV